MAASSSRDTRYARERIVLQELSGVINQTGDSVNRYIAAGRVELDYEGADYEFPTPTTTITCARGADLQVSVALSLEDPHVLSAITGTNPEHRELAICLSNWAILTDLVLCDECERVRQYKNWVFSKRRKAAQEAFEAAWEAEQLEEAERRVVRAGWRTRVLAILVKGKAYQEDLAASWGGLSKLLADYSCLFRTRTICRDFRSYWANRRRPRIGERETTRSEAFYHYLAHSRTTPAAFRSLVYSN